MYLLSRKSRSHRVLPILIGVVISLLGFLPVTTSGSPAGLPQTDTHLDLGADAAVATANGASSEVQPAVTEFAYITRLPLVMREMLSYRLGFGALSKSIDTFEQISSLKAGWYLDWRVRRDPVRPNDMEFVQVIRVHQKLTCSLYSANAHNRDLCPYAEPYDYLFRPGTAEIEAALRANPGSLWLIGNEMDRRDWEGGGQDEMLPETYAIAYHDLYYFMKSIDPGAQVAIGGVIQATPLRLEYLTKIWDAYQQRYGAPMPVDVWNVHNFILQERRNYHGADIPPGSTAQTGAQYPDAQHVNMVIFDQQIRAFRQWMKARGQQDKPLIVSEYGVLYWHEGLEEPNLVQNFMLQTFDYFLNTRDCNLGYLADDCRLVQRWAWYSLEDTGIVSGFNRYGALFDPVTGEITGTGVQYRAYSLANMTGLAVGYVR